MPRIGRAKYHCVNLKSNTGRGGVVSSSGFMGRGLVIRRAITRRSACGKAKCIIGMRTPISKIPWQQIGLDIDGEAAGDLSGWSVSISSDGKTVAIGAPYNDNSNGTDSGHVRVYSWNGTAWQQKGNDIDGESAGDRSGREFVSISSDGNTVAIGAVWNDGNGSNSGHVRVYSWNGTWVKKGNDIDGEAVYDYSGISVSMSSDGNTVAIGSPYNDDNGTNAGHVRVYSWDGTAWVKKGNDIDGESAGDAIGRSVSMSSDGNTVAIGAPWNDNENGAGIVRVYSWDGTAWVKKGNDIDGEAVVDRSGYSVSISSDGNTVAIGAPTNDGNGTDSGHVRVYSWNGAAWVQKGNDIIGEAAYDRSGINVSISSDGNTVAIGAYWNSNKTGTVRVYRWNGAAWVKKGLDIDGEAVVDRSGYSVSMSSDGNTVAIGATNNDGNGDSSGHVRVLYLKINNFTMF